MRLTAEVCSALVERPALRGGKLADGAPDNGSALDDALPVGEALVDFSQATEPLHGALKAAYGETRVACQAQFEKLRRRLRDAPAGGAKVIRAVR
jgi:hypothetical protein